MSALVGYGSSDEEDEIHPERPAKIARIEAHDTDTPMTTGDAPSAPYSNVQPEAPTAIAQPQPSNAEDTAPGPSAQSETELSASTTPMPTPLSPYSTERQRIQELTMPTVPNFDIPDSPPPPTRNSEEAATLAATTKKFERFLQLKKQGVHFNDRLQKSSALRNPSLLPKLMEFAGITLEKSYASTLPAELAVATSWPEECYMDELVRANEEREKKRKDGRSKVDFVAAADARSRGSSATGTPNESGGRKSKFDRR